MSLLTKIGRHHGRMLALAKPTTAFVVASKMTGTSQEQMDDFWSKNKKLNRPMSPHLTIYNLHHLTSSLSLTHRATGIALALTTSGFAFATPFLSQNFDQTILSLQAWNDTWMGYFLLMDIKLLLVLPIVYHTLNGIRHLAWDMGKGFDMKDVRKTGYTVAVLSLLISAAIVYCCK